MRFSSLPVALLLPIVMLGQTGPANLNFEQGTPGQTPPGWVVPTGGYRVEIRTEGCRTSPCAVLSPPETLSPAVPFGNAMQMFAAQPFRGKTIRLRAWIRVERVDPGDRAQMWLRVDLPNRQMGFFDNMGDRPITSSAWESYEISGAVEPDALAIAVGVMSFGKARVWVDDVSFETVTERPPTTEELAAREEIQKLHARMDAALESGKVEAVIALLMPGAQARSGAGSQTQSLASAMEAIKQEIAKGAKYLTRSTVTDLRLSGSDAIATVREESARVMTSGRSEYVSTGRETWTRTPEGWRLKDVVTVSAQMLAPKTDPEAAKAVVAELKQRAVPLATVQAGAEIADLATFGEAVGDARIVALGEASHGTREFFQMKHRLLEYLVKEKGFTVFAIEGNWPEALAADRYIKAGEGDAASALSQMYFWTWQTEEVRDMVEWMRAFNQAPGKHPTLTFTSFDMQIANVAARKALDYLKQVSPPDAAAAEAAYSAASALDGAGMSDDRAKAAFEQASAVVKSFDSRRGAMEQASSPAAWRDGRQAAVIVSQATAMRIPGKGSGHRDEMMASNVDWLLNQAYPGQKIVLWAHNQHVGFCEARFKSMGVWLRERFGKQMYVAGFAFRRGQVRAIGSANGRMTSLAVHDVPPAPEGSGSAILGTAGMPLFYLDMAALPAGTPLSRWLAEEHPYYDIGAVWQTADAELNLFPRAPSKCYDGLIYVDEGHSARGLAAGR